ncbi:MAG: MarR family transcriptional regulator, partial [Pseudomonadota bacterium]
IDLCEQPSCAAILETLLNRQPKSWTELASDLRLHSTTIRRWLKRLVEEDLVRTVDNGYVLSPSGKTPRVLIWSFEGKLRNWQRALYQATRYRAFSHRSFVVMPEQCIAPALKNLDRFKRAKIGLIGVDDDGNITVHSRPPHRVPRSPIYHRVAGAKALQGV